MERGSGCWQLMDGRGKRAPQKRKKSEYKSRERGGGERFLEGGNRMDEG